MNVVLHMFNVNNKITRTKSLILVSLMLSLNTFCATYSTVFLTLNMKLPEPVTGKAFKTSHGTMIMMITGEEKGPSLLNCLFKKKKKNYFI